MANEIVLSDAIQESIEKAVSECNILALAEMTPLQQAVKLATGMNALRRALTDKIMLDIFMPLQGSKLGFVTDRDKPPWNATPEERANWDAHKGYPLPVVRDCLVEALMNGLRPINNEFNIIAGGMYAAKNGLYRQVCEFPGVSDFEVIPSPPVLNEKGDAAKVSLRAEWTMNGQRMSLSREAAKTDGGGISDTRLTIRVNKGMGLDAVSGKAERKLFHATLTKLRAMRGIALTLTDGDAMDTVGVEIADPAPALAPPEQDGKRMRIGAKPAQPAPPPREPGQEG